MKKLIGPFTEIVTLRGIGLNGPLPDRELEIVDHGGLLVENGIILAVGDFEQMATGYEVEEIDQPMVALPGFIDCHTHMCWGGTRAEDYALRTSGASYQEILARKGGIHETVRKTREASHTSLQDSLKGRLDRHLGEGVTTIEIKSGYGLNLEDELKMLEVIQSTSTRADVMATCLAAHVCPVDFPENQAYLHFLTGELLPIVKKRELAHRVDIFVEENAFSGEDADYYLGAARSLGFELTVHADQFTTGGSEVAVRHGALSADHLENSGEKEIELLSRSSTVGVVLPGASLGLGMQYAPARKLLDKGVAVAIASDWNPGSAPMGDLLIQASLLGAYEKLSTAEIFAGLTYRAAAALGLNDRGRLDNGQLADINAFATDNYKEILWHQGKMKPSKVWKKGELV